jgi:uncharacterized membrane protein
MDITLSEFLLFAHITFAALWVGGDAMLQVFSLRATAGGPERSAQFVKDVEWIGKTYITPSALLVVVFGVWLVLEEPVWEISQFWISAALAVFLASFIAGAGFLGPESGRIGKLVDERGADDPEVQSRIGRLRLISRIELLFLVLIVLDMVVKPGFP